MKTFWLSLWGRDGTHSVVDAWFVVVFASIAVLSVSLWACVVWDLIAEMWGKR